jgi:hypothetical protein
VEDDFTSGPWTGFYIEWNGQRDRIDLSLSFKEGRVTGSGVTPVGVFTLAGRYDPEANEMHATLTYPGSHDVFLKGYLDHRGIWGLWEIPGDSTGGFHIWPRGQGTGSGERAAVDVDVPAPVTPP